jgi:hypothetical protein
MKYKPFFWKRGEKLFREQIDTTENENGVRNDALRSGIFGFLVENF